MPVVRGRLRTRDPRWWVAFGGVAGAAMLNKNLVPLLAVTVLVALVIERRWELLRSPWLLGGGVLALPIEVYRVQNPYPHSCSGVRQGLSRMVRYGRSIPSQ